jgi:transposase
LRERIRRKRPELWKNSFILHQDNAPAHTALSVKQFLAEKQIAVLEYPPYSPDLAPCDFFLFPKVKSVLKGTRFASLTEVKKKTTELLRQLTDDELQHGFDQWKIRMQRCVDAEGEYIEGERS